MDDRHLDRLARTLADRTSRRGVLGLLGSLTGFGAEVGQARRRGRGQDVGTELCRTLNQSCTKKQPQIGKRRTCCAGLVCRNKVCRVKECSSVLGCGEGQACCDGTCLDVQGDPKNCGQCGKDCGGSPCLGGRCLSGCVEGQTFCSGACVDLLRDPNHCGACTTTCGAGAPLCQDGRCICRQPADLCLSDEECCQSAEKAPLADPRDWDRQVSCPGSLCCLNQGSVCRDSDDCCGKLQCLGEYGCDDCIFSGKACPSQCPADGPCELCCEGWCDQGVCRATCRPLYHECRPDDPGYFGPCCLGTTCIAGRCELEQSCQNSGQSCSPLLPCCGDLRCNDGVCVLPCNPYASACRSASDCCNGVPCSGGLCRYN